MMISLRKKRYIFSILTVAVSMAFFLFKKGAISETIQPADLLTNRSTETNIFTKKNLKSINDMNLDTASSTSAGIQDDQNLDCWKKIERQYDSMDVFVQKHNEEVAKVVKPWFYNTNFEKQKNPVEESKQGKFFLALAQAGLLEGAKNPIDKNLSQAIQLLNEVIEEDPTNSAPLAYLALIYDSNGEKAKAQKTFSKISSTLKFDSYLGDFTTAIFQTVNTPGDLMSAVTIWTQTPIPNYEQLRKLLIEKKSETMALQLVAGGLNTKNDFIDVNWVPIEYATGWFVLDKLGKNKNLPRLRDLIKNKKNFGSDAGFTELESSCDINVLESEVRRIKGYFIN